jgi:ligand-binding sensor domain-containing protein/signal transduction histidine kinase
MKLTRHGSSNSLARLGLVIAFASFFFPAHRLFSATPWIRQYNSRTWQAEQGLPNNTVLGINQTPDGYLWVATREGLVRFDGTHFRVFDTNNTPGLRSSVISAICVDRQGALWIGSDGLVRFKDGVFSHYGRTDGLAADSIKTIFEKHDGSLWIGTASGMSRLKGGKFTTYTREYFTREPSLISSIVLSVDEGRDGSLWVATSGGLNRIHGDVIDVFTTSNGLSINTLKKVCADREGRVWIGSNNGLIVYENGTFRTYTTGDGLADNFVSAIFEDRDGNLWIGTYAGLNRFVNGGFITEVNNKGAPYDQINDIFQDREGNIWVGSKEGLIELSPKRFFTLAKPQGLSHNNVMSVMEDRKGSLWIGTWGGGLDVWKGGKITVYSAANGLSFPMILSTCEARDGSVWVGAEFNGGVSRFKDGKFTHLSARYGVIDSGIKVIHEDRSNRLWLGTTRGLSCVQGRNVTNYTSTNSTLPGDNVRDIFEDHLGQLWFGTDGGLSRWDNGKFVNLGVSNGLSDNVVNCIFEDTATNFWIGTDNGGLVRYRDGRFTAYTTKQGLFNDRVLEILEDDHGFLWMTCYKGIFRVRREELDALDGGKLAHLHCNAYGSADGMESVQCNGVAKPAGWKARDGRLWFPTTKGLVSADPTLKPNELPPPVFIEEVLADNTIIDRGDPGMSPPAAKPALTMAPGRGELEFRFGALSLSAPETDRFKYRLEGVDSDWKDAGTGRVAHYNNLYPGRYKFQVKAANNDGAWNETGAAVTLELLPHFWQTSWFLVLTSLATVGLIGGAARYLSLRKLRRKLALLEMQTSLERERARIARDIHDDLGSSLTQIALLSQQSTAGAPPEMQSNTRKISVTARDMARALDEIVWAINPEHDTLEGLVEYLTRTADEYLEDSPIRLRLTAPPVMPQCAIPADVRHDLFLAFKEALNNAVKHAKPSEIQIVFTAEAGQLQIVIADNGAGFDLASPRSNGNGLKNMRQRMEAAHGTFEMTSQAGQGTRIKMSVPLTRAGK